MKRRTAITALPLAIFGVAAAVKANVTPAGVIPTERTGILDERQLSHSLELITEASTSSIPCSLVAFAQHLSTLAKSGDCEAIRALAERLTDDLYQEHNHYSETRETWVSEETAKFAEVVDMDDHALSDTARELAIRNARDQHVRRGGESYEV